MAMTPDSGDPGRDPRLEALYRSGSELQQPPPRLDDAIRAAARRAVQAGPRRSADRLRRWSVPLSLVAVMVLSVTLVTMMREEGVDRRIADDIVPPRQPSPLPEAKVAAPDRPAEPPAALAPAAPKGDAPPPVAAAAPAKQAAAGKPALAKPEAARERVHQEARSMEAPERRESALAKTAPAESASAGAGNSVRDARDDQAPPMAAAPRTLRRSAPAAEADATAARGQLMAPATLGAAVTSADPLWRDLEQEPADRWLGRLRELRSAGRQEDFARLSAEFRRRFPDIALPADLR